MEKQYIKDLNDQDKIKSVFLVGEKHLLKDKNGKNYLNLNLADKSGSLNARMWDKADTVADSFSQGDFIQVKGHVQVYQSKKQIVIHDLEKVAINDVKIENFLATTENDLDELYNNLVNIVQSIGDENIKTLIMSVLEDGDNKELLKKSPAAKAIHHAYVGGLLEHVLSICGIMDFLASHYKFLDRDLLIFGAIFHDLGKIKELNVEESIKYSDEGRLVGHLSMATTWVETYSAKIDGFPEELKNNLKHIVLSHHGKLEYGSPKRPKFLEALLVSMVDELDSRVDSIKSVMMSEIDSDSSWTSYNPMYDRYFYLDILRKQLGK